MALITVTYHGSEDSRLHTYDIPVPSGTKLVSTVVSEDTRLVRVATKSVTDRAPLELVYRNPQHLTPGDTAIIRVGGWTTTGQILGYAEPESNGSLSDLAHRYLPALAAPVGLSEWSPLT